MQNLGETGLILCATYLGRLEGSLVHLVIQSICKYLPTYLPAYMLLPDHLFEIKKCQLYMWSWKNKILKTYIFDI